MSSDIPEVAADQPELVEQKPPRGGSDPGRVDDAQ
jgi:hypothetical protein